MEHHDEGGGDMVPWIAAAPIVDPAVDPAIGSAILAAHATDGRAAALPAVPASASVDGAGGGLGVAGIGWGADRFIHAWRVRSRRAQRAPRHPALHRHARAALPAGGPGGARLERGAARA